VRNNTPLWQRGARGDFVIHVDSILRSLIIHGSRDMVQEIEIRVTTEIEKYRWMKWSEDFCYSLKNFLFRNSPKRKSIDEQNNPFAKKYIEKPISPGSIIFLPSINADFLSKLIK